MTIGSFESQSRSVSPGLITKWSGALSEIPDGYVLCDGNNGTPDLTGKFTRAPASAGSNPTGTGGQDSITLSKSQLPSHTHSGSSDTAGSSHNHTVYGDSPLDGYPNDSSEGLGGNSNNGGNHSHYVDMGSTGGSSSINNKPPYYEVAYLMKL